MEEKDVKLIWKMLRWISAKVIPIDKEPRLHFDKEPRVQKRQKWKTDSFTHLFSLYSNIQIVAGSTSPDMTTAFYARPYW